MCVNFSQQSRRTLLRRRRYRVPLSLAAVKGDHRGAPSACLPLDGGKSGGKFHLGPNPSELNNGKTGNQSEVADIQSCDGIAEMLRRGANQQIFEGNAYVASSLLALYFPSELGDFECYWMDLWLAKT